jgi:hypothetical protein
MSDRLLVRPVAQLCQIAAAMASRRCATRVNTPCGGAAAVGFEVELTFEGLVDRLDPLPDATKVAVAVGLVAAVRAQQLKPHRPGQLLELFPAKPLSANRTWPSRMRW